MPSCPARRRWFQSCMVRPMTLCPSARSMAATVEESTPPDMATAMVSVFGIRQLLALALPLALGFRSDDMTRIALKPAHEQSQDHCRVR